MNERNPNQKILLNTIFRIDASVLKQLHISADRTLTFKSEGDLREFFQRTLNTLLHQNFEKFKAKELHTLTSNVVKSEDREFLAETAESFISWQYPTWLSTYNLVNELQQH